MQEFLNIIKNWSPTIRNWSIAYSNHLVGLVLLLVKKDLCLSVITLTIYLCVKAYATQSLVYSSWTFRLKWKVTFESKLYFRHLKICHRNFCVESLGVSEYGKNTFARVRAKSTLCQLIRKYTVPKSIISPS